MYKLAEKCLSVATPTLQKGARTEKQAKYLQARQLVTAGLRCLTS